MPEFEDLGHELGLAEAAPGFAPLEGFGLAEPALAFGFSKQLGLAEGALGFARCDLVTPLVGLLLLLLGELVPESFRLEFLAEPFPLERFCFAARSACWAAA